MRAKPEISVVMAVYNGAPWLIETVESILTQRDVNLEFIIVNDGSTDGVESILETYALRDPRVRVITQANQGLTRALIAGCHLALGHFIARQDCGDISLPGRLRMQLDAISALDNCKFVSCWAKVVGPEREYLYELQGSGPSGVPSNIIDLSQRHGVSNGPTVHSSVMFRLSTYREVGGYRKEFYFGQDWDLWYRLAEKGTFIMLPAILLEYRVTPSSISTSHKGSQEKFAALSRKALAFRCAGEDDSPILEEASSVRSRPNGVASPKTNYTEGNYFIGSLLAKNDDHRAQKYLVAAIRENPRSIRAWIKLVFVSTRYIFK